MARTRLLSPDFFASDDLGSLPPLARLLFAGLWTIADRCGRLEDRPARIRAAVLPYDNCDGDALLNDLARVGCIERYDGFIEICSWARYQKPHPNEIPSEIPVKTADSRLRTTKEVSTTDQGAHQSVLILDPRSDLTPPSAAKCVSPTPLALVASSKVRIRTAKAVPADPDFDAFWQAYPVKTGKGAARMAWDRAKPTGVTVATCLAALEWQRASVHWTRDGGQYVPHPATWLNQARWLDEPVEITPTHQLPKRTAQAMVDMEAWLRMSPPTVQKGSK